MRKRPTKPKFLSVLDLGLRDVGVPYEPRRFASFVGRSSVKLTALVLMSVFMLCVIARLVGARGLIVVLPLLWMGGLLWLAFRMSARAPIVVLKVTEERGGQISWLTVVPLVLLVVNAVLIAPALAIPMLLFAGGTGLLLWRARKRLVRAVAELRSLLEPDETVLGDGAGAVPKALGWNAAFRLVVATDRRLIVTGAPRTEPFVLVDVPYERIAQFDVDWKYLGRFGELWLNVAGPGGEPGEVHAIGSMAPANLVSIATALESHGVPPDDPDAVDDARRDWEQARRREAERPSKPRRRLFDSSAMNTEAFDHGLWLLLAVCPVGIWVNPLGGGHSASAHAGGLVLLVAVVAGVCGYLSGTKASLAYLVPLNAVISPVFFFTDASDVVWLMVVLSVFAAAALWGGSALRSAIDDQPATAPAAPRAPRGTLRYTVGGVSLIRLTGIVLILMLAVVTTASAAGIELPALRLAIDESRYPQLPVDGHTNLTGGAASFRYTPGPDLHELITDRIADDAPYDGARWELRSSWTKGFNVVSLAHYVENPPLDSAAAIANFVSQKDEEHARLAGFAVRHTEITVDGRHGYVWNHGSLSGYWYYAAWFPQPVHSVRIECIARNQKDRFKRLCAEAVHTLKFNL